MTTFLASIPSPPQGVWHLGWLPIRAYALFIIVGIIVALVIGDRRWVARGGEPGVIYDIALWAVPFGLIGGRLYHVMTDWRTYFGDEGAGFLAALRIWDGGLGIWGAVALGGVGAWIGCRRRGIPLPAFGDAIAPGIVLAQAIGRLGNYFNQELFGRPTSLPWGLKIYERRDASGALDMLNGVSTGQPADIAPQPVHPTFLYELIWNVLVFVLLIYVDRRFKIGHGRLFALYVAAYCVGRFGVELLRDDTATLIAGIRINLFTSTFVFVGAMVYIIVAPKGREDPATLAGKAHDRGEEPQRSRRKRRSRQSRRTPRSSSGRGSWRRSRRQPAVVAGVAVAVEDEDREEAEEEAAEAAASADKSRDEAQDAETAVLDQAAAPEAAEEFEPDVEPTEEAVDELAEPQSVEQGAKKVPEPESAELETLEGEELVEPEAEPTGEAAEAVGEGEAEEAAEQAEVAGQAEVEDSARKPGWLARLRSRRANRLKQAAEGEPSAGEEPIVAAAEPTEAAVGGAAEAESATEQEAQEVGEPASAEAEEPDEDELVESEAEPAGDVAVDAEAAAEEAGEGEAVEEPEPAEGETPETEDVVELEEAVAEPEPEQAVEAEAEHDEQAARDADGLGTGEPESAEALAGEDLVESEAEPAEEAVEQGAEAEAEEAPEPQAESVEEAEGAGEGESVTEAEAEVEQAAEEVVAEEQASLKR